MAKSIDYKQIWRQRQFIAGNLELYKKRIEFQGEEYELPEISSQDYIHIAPITNNNEIIAVKQFSFIHECDYLTLLSVTIDNIGGLNKGEISKLILDSAKNVLGIEAKKIKKFSKDFSGIHETSISEIYTLHQLEENAVHELPERVLEVVLLKSNDVDFKDNTISQSLKLLAASLKS